MRGLFVGTMMLVGVLAGGCGDAAATDGPPLPDGGSGGAGAGAGGAGGGATLSDCPAEIPSGACDSVGLACGYGDHLMVSCRTQAYCSQEGQWGVSVPTDTCDSWTSDSCPADWNAPPTELCDDPWILCAYDDAGICSCATGEWACHRNDSDACPIVPANVGDPCDTPVSCEYEEVACARYFMICEDGVWRRETATGLC